MLTLERPPSAVTPPPAPAVSTLSARDRRIVDAIVQATPRPALVEGADDARLRRLIPWIGPVLAVLVSATILLIWATVLA